MKKIVILPYVLAEKARKDENWQIECLNPENQGQFYRFDFAVKYKGETVCTLSRLYGFGFSSQWVEKQVESRHILPLCHLLGHQMHMDNLWGISGAEGLEEPYFLRRYAV